MRSVSMANQPGAEIAADWLGSRPTLSGDYRRDAAVHSHFWLAGADLLGKLPLKAKRSARLAIDAPSGTKARNASAFTRSASTSARDSDE